MTIMSLSTDSNTLYICLMEAAYWVLIISTESHLSRCIYIGEEYDENDAKFVALLTNPWVELKREKQ